MAGVKTEINEEKWVGEARRLLDHFMGLAAEKLALTLASPRETWQAPKERVLCGGRAGRELTALAAKRRPISLRYAAASGRCLLLRENLGATGE
jgi:hypothetical protein